MDSQEQSTLEEFFERFEFLSSKIPFQRNSDEFTIVNIDNDIENLTDIFRWLRNNSSRLNESSKNELLDTGLLDTCLWFCTNCFINKPLSCSVLLQFLANFSMNNEIAQCKIFQSFNNVLKYVSSTSWFS